MSLILFNTEENIGELENFKLLPNELQDSIADYTEEGYNKKCFDYDWYEIVESISWNFGWEYLICFLNAHLTQKTELLTQKHDCRKIRGMSHTCVEFITCDEKIEVGFDFQHIKMHPGKMYFWDDECVCPQKATQLIIDKIDEYIYSNRYDSNIMYIINKHLLLFYYNDD